MSATYTPRIVVCPSHGRRPSYETRCGLCGHVGVHVPQEASMYRVVAVTAAGVATLAEMVPTLDAARQIARAEERMNPGFPIRVIQDEGF